MATQSPRSGIREIPLSEYPTHDGRPMGETEVHINDLIATLDVLRARYADDPRVYVGGNMMMYYVPNDKRRHISPDVFVVRGVPRAVRDAYFVWVEGKGPDFILELTSKSTRKEDVVQKFQLYQDVLRVPEYFLFDPREEYLKPSMQGFRLIDGRYAPIAPIGGRLRSEALDLELGREGTLPRFFDPASGEKLLTANEQLADIKAAHRRAEVGQDLLAQALKQSEADRARLLRELDELRRRLPPGE